MDLKLRAAIAALLIMPVAAWAQLSVAPPPPSATPRDPVSLPGDNAPPPLAAVTSPPRPPSNTPPPPRPVVPGPSAALALEAVQAAMAKCRADGLKVGVAVSNSQGVLIAGVQMDGLAPGRIYNAARKNLAAIAFGTPTSAVRDKLRANDAATLAAIRPNMTLFPGAVPLMSGGKVIGAIGASGATSDQDEACAAAGAAAIAGKL